MAWTVDLMDHAFEEIALDGSKLLDDDFMFALFQPRIEKVPPFQEYTIYMFEEKTSNQRGRNPGEEKVLPWEQLRQDVMYTTRRDIHQDTDMSCELAVVAAIAFRKEFRDEKENG